MRTAALVAWILLMIVVACGPVQPLKPDVVPQSAVPAGYIVAECHYEGATQEDRRSGVDSGGSASAAVSQADSGGHDTQRVIKCHHETNIHIERCFDDNAVEHPMQWCKDRKAARDRGELPPTSQLPRLCGTAGVLQHCDDDAS
jgi:hypothetical protein